MTWNHRVVKEVLDNGDEWFTVREVFYNDDGSIFAYTEEPADVCGESIDEIREYLQWCLNCLDKPILEEGKVEFIYKDFCPSSGIISLIK